MAASAATNIIGFTGWLSKAINYELIEGNAIWRFVLVLLTLLAAMAAGQIIQYILNKYALGREKKRGPTVVTLFLKCLTKPISVALFAMGLLICKALLVFGEKAISPTIEKNWTKIAQAVVAIAAIYAIYRLVDIIEYYLQRWTSRTETKLDDMLVPVVRKSLRITIAIVGTIYIIDNVLEQNVQSILLSAGVGGIAIALAAKDTIANFFGSVTIFADRPFQVDDLVRIGDHYGPIEEVGFRSTKIRTLQGHLVIIPNSMVANSTVENVGQRPFIRRTSNITITYDSGHTKAEKAVQIIKDVLSKVPEVNQDPGKPPRVYFNEFNDCALNIYVSYWVKPPDYWLYHEVNERVNLEIMRRFEAEKIEFAFPTQTLYLKKD